MCIRDSTPRSRAGSMPCGGCISGWIARQGAGTRAGCGGSGTTSTPSRDVGLDVEQTPEGLELHLAGGTTVFVYPSSDYTAPEHTVLNFVVDDIDAAIDGLGQRGVRLEHYD